MSEKDKNQNKKNEEKEKADGSTSRDQPLANSEDKKGKRSLRFQLPTTDVRSEESFTSALSYNLADDDDEDDGDDYDDFARQQGQAFSFLKKYVPTPLHHTSPRTASMKPCFQTHPEDEAKFFISSANSSRQLFEILRHSPTPSDADMNLINATYLRKLAAVKEAINNGADVNTFRDRQTPLLIATEIGDVRLVSYLLTVPNINPDFQNDFGQTPLIVAVRNAFDQIVRLLLNHNADVNIADNMGKTPLHGALFQQRVGLTKLLLAFGADYEKPDCFGERPMYTSVVKKPNLECLTTLLKIGASPEYCNVTGIPLLSRAILSGTEFNIIETLVHYGAVINSQDFVSRKTPLHFAALTNNVKVAKLLVNKGADVNIRTTYNFNPLEEAIFQGSTDVIEYLTDKTLNAKVKTLTSIKPRPSQVKERQSFNIKELKKK